MTTITEDRETVSAVEVTESDDAKMVDYITNATAEWWSYLFGFTVEFCRERFTTEFARGLVQDVYAHKIEQGASEADAVAAAGTVMVRNVIAVVSDERAAALTSALRDHVRQSFTQD